jgi:F0F1-type ATP synthase assembly protein I
VKRNFDRSAFVFGVLYVAAAVWWLIDRAFNVHLPNAGWLVAILLILGGAIGIGSAIRAADRARNRDDLDRDAWRT